MKSDDGTEIHEIHSRTSTIWISDESARRLAAQVAARASQLLGDLAAATDVTLVTMDGLGALQRSPQCTRDRLRHTVDLFCEDLLAEWGRLLEEAAWYERVMRDVPQVGDIAKEIRADAEARHAQLAAVVARHKQRRNGSAGK